VCRWLRFFMVISPASLNVLSASELIAGISCIPCQANQTGLDRFEVWSDWFVGHTEHSSAQTMDGALLFLVAPVYMSPIVVSVDIGLHLSGSKPGRYSTSDRCWYSSIRSRRQARPVGLLNWAVLKRSITGSKSVIWNDNIARAD